MEDLALDSKITEKTGTLDIETCKGPIEDNGRVPLIPYLICVLTNKDYANLNLAKARASFFLSDYSDVGAMIKVAQALLNFSLKKKI